jgi:hypothetical protein
MRPTQRIGGPAGEKDRMDVAEASKLAGLPRSRPSGRRRQTRARACTRRETAAATSSRFAAVTRSQQQEYGRWSRQRIIFLRVAIYVCPLSHSPLPTHSSRNRLPSSLFHLIQCCIILSLAAPSPNQHRPHRPPPILNGTTTYSHHSSSTAIRVRTTRVFV